MTFRDSCSPASARHCPYIRAAAMRESGEWASPASGNSLRSDGSDVLHSRLRHRRGRVGANLFRVVPEHARCRAFPDGRMHETNMALLKVLSGDRSGQMVNLTGDVVVL